jgi:6-phosphogluconolactonase
MWKRRLTLGLATLFLALSPLDTLARASGTELVFAGSGHKNIYAFRLATDTGQLTPLGEAAQVDSASFLATAPNRKFLYAISAGSQKEDSLVIAFRIDPATGKLAFINRQTTGGTGPCFVSVEQKGKDVLAANYNSGSVAVFPLDGQGVLQPMSAFVQDHGSSVNPRRQEGPHAHCFETGPDDKFAFACDLGLDKVMVFKFDPAKGLLEANTPDSAPIKPGQGPRHIAFHPNGKYAYVISELASTVTVFGYDRTRGVLSEIEDHSLLPDGFKGQNYAAEVAVHPSGKFVFASNRGDDSIVVFACNPKTGKLVYSQRQPAGGRYPRSFEIDPSGAFLLAANQESGTLSVFRIDSKTGHLQPVGGLTGMDMPLCVNFPGL